MVYEPDLITRGAAKNIKDIVINSGWYTMGWDYLNKWEWGVIINFRSSTFWLNAHCKHVGRKFSGGMQNAIFRLKTRGQELSNDIEDTPMLVNISMSYTVGKLLKPPFQCTEVCNCIFEYLLPVSLMPSGSLPEVPFFNLPLQVNGENLSLLTEHVVLCIDWY